MSSEPVDVADRTVTVTCNDRYLGAFHLRDGVLSYEATEDGEFLMSSFFNNGFVVPSLRAPARPGRRYQITRTTFTRQNPEEFLDNLHLRANGYYAFVES